LKEGKMKGKDGRMDGWTDGWMEERKEEVSIKRRKGGKNVAVEKTWKKKFLRQRMNSWN